MNEMRSQTKYTWIMRSGAVAFGVFLMFSFGLMRAHQVAADDTSSTDQAPPADNSSTPPATNAPDANTSSSDVNSRPQDVASTDANAADATNTAATSADTGGNAAPGADAGGDATTTPSLTSPDTASTDATDTVSTTGGTDSSSTDAGNASTTDTAPADGGQSGGNGGGSAITTGNAAAVVNIENVVNTNIVNSQGFLSLLNLFEPYFGNIDFSTLDFAPFAESCAACVSGSITVNSTNTASIVNNVSVTASTGGNAASSNGGASTIQTGNAFAAANIVNIANANLVNANYLLLVLNNFSEMNGDLVLPGADFFANLLGGGNGTGGGNLTVDNNNTATISNTVETNADTGGNAATGSGAGAIMTGNAAAASNALTVANANLTGGSEVFILVRVFGNWNGGVFSAPPGIEWQQTPDGIALTGSGVNSVLCGCSGSTTITNTNAATVANNVRVYALTGANKISGSGSIVAGNAGAVANTINIVNTNVVGRNILLALVNIFGDWRGNLAFGQPDLWIGATADAPPVLTPGSIVTYRVTVKNNGTADATNVQVQASDDQDGLAVITDTGGGTASTSSVAWTIPVLSRGASQTFTYTERMTDPLPFYGDGELTESIRATEREDDANPADNQEQISFGVRAPAMNMPWQSSSLWLKEYNDAQGTVPPGGSAHFRLIVGNKGIGPASNVIVRETLYNPFGEPVSTSTWALGTLDPGDVYMVSYDAGFAPNLPTGWFISYSSIDAWDVTGHIRPNSSFVSSSSVYVVNPDDNIPKPPSPVILVPPPDGNTATTTKIGDNNTNIRINTLPENTRPENLRASSKNAPRTLAGLSCQASNGSMYGGNTTTSIRRANLAASLSDIFNNGSSVPNFTNIQDFITSTLLAFGAVLMKFR